MIGIYASSAASFATVVCASIIVVFGIPLTFFTLAWARLMRWSVPQEDPWLAVYFGRCTGLLAVCICGFGLWCVRHPVHLPAFFTVFLAAMCTMAVLHVWGALRQQQPLSETLEIGLWAALIAGTLMWFPLGT